LVNLQTQHKFHFIPSVLALHIPTHPHPILHLIYEIIESEYSAKS
jgi:hypothetical protein